MTLFDRFAPDTSGRHPRQAAEPSGGAGESAASAGESGDAPSDGAPVLTVSGLSDALKRRFIKWGRLAVEGEITGLKRAGSGHIYFTLKEGGAVISCAIWRSRVEKATRTPLEDGTQVVCHGTLDIYPPRGTYSLLVDRVEQRGLGELLARLERLKADLRAKGWFDRARPLPTLPSTIGIVTSRDADGFEDFLRTRSLRWPLYPLRLIHTRVQGPGAAEEIARALADLDASGVDLICLVRGGGSMEDLWAFNEQVVAQAIWASSVPVVTGIGHEPDVSLADLVADFRAHTPTDAAQTVIPDRRGFLETLERQAAHLEQALERCFEERVRRLDQAAGSQRLRSPAWILTDRTAALVGAGRRLGLAAGARVQQGRAHLDRLGGRLARHSPAARLASLAGRVEALAPRLVHVGNAPVERRGKALDLAERALTGVSPFAVLGRGYSITRLVKGGAALTSSSDVEPGVTLETILAEGSVQSTVTRTLGSEGQVR